MNHPSLHLYHHPDIWKDEKDILPIIFSYLPWKCLVTKIRRVNRTWCEAVRWTPVHSVTIILEEDSTTSTSTSSRDTSLAAMLRDIIHCIPRLQRLRFQGVFLEEETLCWIATGWRDLKRLDLSTESGDTTIPSAAAAAASATTTTITTEVGDAFFSTSTIQLVFQNLNQLTYLDVSGNALFGADLTDVALLPNLQVLNCQGTIRMTGSLFDLAKLGTTLYVCDLQGCPKITGSIRDLAGCQELLYLGLRGTSVHGTLPEMDMGDYPCLIYIDLLHGGAMDNVEEDARLFVGKDLAFVSSAPVVVNQAYRLRRTLPSIRLSLCTYQLSRHSPNFYSKPENPRGLWSRDPPFTLEMLEIEGRIGWRWTNGKERGACDIRWIDPMPNFATREAFLLYQVVLQSYVTEESIYNGLLDPPMEEEHNDLMYKKLIQRRRQLRRQKDEL
jgi:hypothetical protein